MRWISVILVLGLLVCVGCGGQSTPFAAVGKKIGATDRGKEASAPTQAAQDTKPVGEFVGLQDAQEDPKGVKPAVKAVQQRKIRYTSDVKLIVEEFAAAEKGLKEAVKEAEADIAKGEVNSSPGSVRKGTWKIRVPVKHFDTFREALFKLGDVEQNLVDSEDLTAAYYDLEAYIENRTKEETAMNKLLEKAGDRDLDVFIKLKRERDAIRLDINMHEGRRRLMANLTDLTTVNLTILEKQKNAKEAVPTVTPVPPTFGARASTTFGDSSEAFVGFVQSITLVVIAVTPWLPIPIVLGAIAWLAVRIVRARVARLAIAADKK